MRTFGTLFTLRLPPLLVSLASFTCAFAALRPPPLPRSALALALGSAPGRPQKALSQAVNDVYPPADFWHSFHFAPPPLLVSLASFACAFAALRRPPLPP